MSEPDSRANRCTLVQHGSPAAFLARAEPWLLTREDEHNLHLSLAYARREKGEAGTDALFGTVESEDVVVGCVIRTPPHKLLVTTLPTEATREISHVVAELYEEIPGVLGPADIAEAVATGWVEAKGGSSRPGMRQRIYRLDEVTPPSDIDGRLRTATPADLDLVLEWANGFARDVGHQFAMTTDAIVSLIERGALFIWEDGEAVSMAAAQGRTPSGIRVGYVYTPEESRRRGYASAAVAELSQQMLDSGVRFCVLYTDLSNPTSNAIYQRVGYKALMDVCDFDVLPPP